MLSWLTRMILSIGVTVVAASHAQAMEKCDEFKLSGRAAGSEFVKNYAESWRLYSIMKNCDFVLGYIGVGEHYENGWAVQRNYKEAVKHYGYAATRGHSLAAFHLAKMYADGKGVLQNYVTAHILANLAALDGGGGVQEEASSLLVALSSRMTPGQISVAQDRAAKCKALNKNMFTYKNCGF